MKKIDYFLWYFPICFLVFFAIYLLVKFIFIFFFRSAFEPGFIFDLTPFYLLSGINNLNLISLSLIVIWFDVYLHIKISKKNLIISFLPTGIMLAGLGFQIAVKDLNISGIFYYIIFFCLLFIALIDHKHILIFPDIISQSKRHVFAGITKDKVFIDKLELPSFKPPPIEKTIRIEGIDEVLTLHKETLSDLRELIEDNLKKEEIVIEKLDEKTKKIDQLVKDVEERRKRLIQDEILFRKHLIYSLDQRNFVKSIDFNKNLTFKPKQEIDYQKTMLDDFLGCAAILKRGILKQVNNSFAELLGYKIEELLDKSLFDFVVPEGLSGFKKYFLDRLKGKSISSFETIFITKDDNKIAVEVTIKPKYFNSERVEIAVVRCLKSANLNNSEQFPI